MSEAPVCTCGVGAQAKFHARSCAVVRTPSRDAGTAPYVEAGTPVPVTATVKGERWPGEVLGCRGERVYVRWRTGMGSHVGWLTAGDVERT